MKNEAQGWRRLIAASQYSAAGLAATYKSEAAFRQEVRAAVILVPLAFIIGETALETSLLISTVLLLMIVELLNSAVEFVVDRIGDEFHELSGRAKDAGSAAVLLTLFLMITIWVGVILS